MPFSARSLCLGFAAAMLSTLVVAISKNPPISITIHPTNVTADRSKHLIVKCEASGSGVRYSWLKDGIPISKLRLPSVQNTSDGFLLFTPFIYNKTYRGNVGYYQCVASNSAGDAVVSKAALVQVDGLSKFKSPEDVSAYVGDMVRFYGAALSAYPVPTHEWTNGGGSVLATGSKNGRLHVLPNGALHLTDLLLADSTSQYVLRLQNSRDTHTFPPATLTVSSQPSSRTAPCKSEFSYFPAEVVVSVGNTAVLEAVVGDLGCHQSRPATGWAKNSQFLPITSSARYQLIAFSLVITDVDWNDAGVYEIDISDGKMTLKNSTRLIVHGRPVIETVFPAAQDMPTRGIATLNCSVIGTPLPTIHWLRNGKSLQADDVRIHIYSNGTMVKIQNFTGVDEGFYQCMAENSEGKDISATYLFAGDGPPGPVTNVSIYLSPEEHLTIIWYRPSFPNGQITQYTIYYDILEGDKSLTVANASNYLIVPAPPASNLSQVITSALPGPVQHGSMYGVIIVGQTSGGIGEPSVVFTRILDSKAPGGPPLGVRASLAGSSLTVSWKPPEELLQHGRIASYRILYVNQGSSRAYLVDADVRNKKFVVNEETTEVNVSVAAATKSLNGDQLWGPYSDKIVHKIDKTTPTPSQKGSTPPVLATAPVQLSSSNNKTNVVSDTFELILFIAAPAGALLLFIILCVAICCCCRNMESDSKAVSSSSRSTSESVKGTYHPTLTVYEDALPQSIPMTSFASQPTEHQYEPLSRRGSKPDDKIQSTPPVFRLPPRTPAELPAEPSATPQESRAVRAIHVEQAPPPYEESDNRNGGPMAVGGSTPPFQNSKKLPTVAPKPKSHSPRRNPRLHFPPAPASPPERQLSSPQRRMSLKEQTDLESMMQELKRASPVAEDGLQDCLSPPEGSESPLLPPPPPPLEDSPPRPPLPVELDMESSPEPEKAAAQDELDDIMKQLEMDTENLDVLLDGPM